MSSQSVVEVEFTRETNLQPEECDGAMTMRQILENVDVEESVSFRSTSLRNHLTIIKWIGIIAIALTCTFRFS
jgi:hypothetical protein